MVLVMCLLVLWVYVHVGYVTGGGGCGYRKERFSTDHLSLATLFGVCRVFRGGVGVVMEKLRLKVNENCFIFYHE